MCFISRKSKGKLLGKKGNNLVKAGLAYKRSFSNPFSKQFLHRF